MPHPAARAASSRGTRDASRPASTARATATSTLTDATTGAPIVLLDVRRTEAAARLSDEHDAVRAGIGRRRRAAGRGSRPA